MRRTIKTISADSKPLELDNRSVYGLVADKMFTAGYLDAASQFYALELIYHIFDILCDSPAGWNCRVEREMFYVIQRLAQTLE